jgi:hypothetical protein
VLLDHVYRVVSKVIS